MASKKKKSLKLKSILITLALILGLGGYLTFRNLAVTPTINYADGLDPEEAAFLQKKIKQDKNVSSGGSVGTAPDPVVKVTVKKKDNEGKETGEEVTATVILNKPDKDPLDNDITDIAKQIKNEVENKGIVTNSQGVIVGGGFRNPTGPVTGAGGAITQPGGGTCGTNGSPVLSGTAVATGQYETDDKGKQILDIDHAYCRKCNGGTYGGDELCKNLVNSGYPVALPTHLESSFRDAQGTVVKIHKCFATVDGLNVQVGGGETVETKTGKKQCNPGDGLLVDPNSPSGKALLTDGMKSFCSFRGMDSSEGKCVAKTPPKVEDVKSDADYLREREEKRKQAIEDRKKKCSTTAECDQKTCEAVVAENGGASQYRCTLIQGTKNYGLIPANHNITISATNSTLSPKTQSATLNQPATEKPYTTKTKCEATISNTNTQNCVPVQGGGYVRVAADSGRTYISYSFGTYKPTTSTPQSPANPNTPTTPINTTTNLIPDTTQQGFDSDVNCGRHYNKPCVKANGRWYPAQGETSYVITNTPTPPTIGSITPGNTCASPNNDSSCDSGDCRKLIKPGTTKQDWYCMSSTQSIISQSQPKNIGKQCVETQTLNQSLPLCKDICDKNTNGGYANTDISTQATTVQKCGAPPKLQKNGSPCSGKNSVCESGYCGINAGFWFVDVCETNPFTNSTVNSQPDQTTLQLTAKEKEAQQHIENLQTKYKLVLEKNALAFTNEKMTLDECENKNMGQCIPIPGQNTLYVTETSIKDQVNKYSIELP